MSKSNLLIFTICITLLLIGSAVFYRYVIYLPSIQNEKLKQTKIKQEKYDECIELAYSQYEKTWNLRCSSYFNIVLDNLHQCEQNLLMQGIQRSDATERCYVDYPVGNYAGGTCKSLPVDSVKDIDEELHKEKEQCLKLL